MNLSTELWDTVYRLEHDLMVKRWERLAGLGLLDEPCWSPRGAWQALHSRLRPASPRPVPAPVPATVLPGCETEPAPRRRTAVWRYCRGRVRRPRPTATPTARR